MIVATPSGQHASECHKSSMIANKMGKLDKSCELGFNLGF
jgi:hypothetical protein